MKRKQIERKRNFNAKKKDSLQLVLDSNGKQLFHGAFQGGSEKEIHVENAEDFQTKGFVYFKNGKRQKFELGIDDIVDENDGIDYKRNFYEKLFIINIRS